MFELLSNCSKVDFDFVCKFFILTCLKGLKFHFDGLETVEQIVRQDLICAVRRFSAPIIVCNSGRNHIAAGRAGLLEAGTARYRVDHSPVFVIFSTTSVSFLELLISVASLAGWVTSAPFFTYLTGSESIVSLWRSFVDFTWMNSSLENIFESFSTKPSSFEHICVSLKPIDVIKFECLVVCLSIIVLDNMIPFVPRLELEDE